MFCCEKFDGNLIFLEDLFGNEFLWFYFDDEGCCIVDEEIFGVLFWVFFFCILDDLFLKCVKVILVVLFCRCFVVFLLVIVGVMLCFCNFIIGLIGVNVWLYGMVLMSLYL